MGKSSPDPPQPVLPNPKKTAAAQFKYGKKAAVFNKQLAESTWQQTPYGSLRYEQVPFAEDPVMADIMARYPRSKGRPSSVLAQMKFEGKTPTTRQVQTLHPAEQRLLDQQRVLKGQYGDVAGQLMGKASGLFGTPLDTSSLGAMPVANEATRQSVINSLMERYQPQQVQDRSALETQLANQGFVRGSTAWDSAMDQINRRETDFRLAANLQAGDEMRADLAQRLGIRQQSLQELLMPRNQTLQELSTFMTGSQPAMPQFAPVSAPQVSAPDYAGLVAANAQMQNQANMAAYNAASGQGSGIGSLVGGVAGAYFGGPAGAMAGSSIGGQLGSSIGSSGGGQSTYSGQMPGGATSSGGWSFGAR